MKYSKVKNICFFGLLAISVFCCKKTEKRSAPPAQPTSQASILESKFDFLGGGKNWTISLDFSEVSILVVKEDTIEIESTMFRFTNGNTSNSELGLLIDGNNCSATEHYSISIDHEGKTLEGCGHYLNPAYELIGKWEAATASTIQIDFMSLLKVKGFDGCNQFFGHYEASLDLIDFQAISGTKKACPSSTPSIAEALSGFVNYRVSNDSLWITGKTEKHLFLRSK